MNKLLNQIIASLTLFSIVFLPVQPSLAALTVNYKDYKLSTGKIEKMYHKVIDENDLGNVTVKRTLESDEYKQDEEYVLDEDYATRSWSIKRAGDKLNYEGHRDGNTLTITGTLNGRPVNKQIELDDRPLFNHPKVNLSKFVLSDDNEIQFWGLRKSNLQKYSFEAKKLGEETIVINGQPIETIKVHFSPTKKAFRKYYKRTYYFRKSDGLFVKKAESKGKSTELILSE